MEQRMDDLETIPIPDLDVIPRLQNMLRTSWEKLSE
jgi:hypothetical protein